EEPFGGETPLITLHRISTEKPESIRAKNPEIPNRLARTIASLMAKRPEDRPRSAEQARRLLLGEAPPRGRSTIGRRFLIASALAGLAAAALGAVFLSRSATSDPSSVTVTTADGLERAVATLPDGGSIEIDTDAVLAVHPLSVGGRSAIIAAADGRTPVIELLLREHDDAPEHLLHASGGELRLVGVELRDDLQPEGIDDSDFETAIEGEEYGLVSIEHAAFTAVGCRFETRSLGRCLELTSCPRAELQDCRLFAREGSAIHWIADVGQRLALDDCVSASTSTLIVTATGHANLEWTRSTALAKFAFMELTHGSGSLSAGVSDSIVQSAEALVATSLARSSRAEFERLLTWRGSGNRIRGHSVEFADQEDTPAWAEDVASWAAEDRDSTYGSRVFRGSHQAVEAALVRGSSVEDLLAQ
ncbi:MAG: hypothetical protein AAF596_05855, partial [Planctomycetota bacterium]